jgi:hypothetical protein
MDPAPRPVYDCRDPYPVDPDGDQSLELPGPQARYEQLAAILRGDIYAGVYPVGSALPPESELARERGISRALANRALQVVADQELVSQEQGRGTYVQPRRLYRVRVSVPLPDDGGKAPTPASLRRAARDAARGDPAVAEVESAESGNGIAAVTLLVEAADGDWAVHAAKLAVKSAGRPWHGEGCDLALASYECHPA